MQDSRVSWTLFSDGEPEELVSFAAPMALFKARERGAEVLPVLGRIPRIRGRFRLHFRAIQSRLASRLLSTSVLKLLIYYAGRRFDCNRRKDYRCATRNHVPR